MEAERLQKYLARCGVASRREAESIIERGDVSVNGKKVTELGIKVTPGVDRVEVRGQSVVPVNNYVYIAMNKPKGVVTTVADPQGRKTVMSFLGQVRTRVYPVGRLDFDTQGLLLLTNDGDVAHALTHPSHHIDKTYLAEVQGKVSHSDLMRLMRGVELDDGRTAPAKARIAATSGPFCIVELTIHEGRNRQVRRMMEAIGHPVRGLQRTRFGPIKLGPLTEGKWRYLSAGEIDELKAVAREVQKTSAQAQSRSDSMSDGGDGGDGRHTRKGQSSHKVRLQRHPASKQVSTGKQRPRRSGIGAEGTGSHTTTEGADSGHSDREHRYKRRELQGERPGDGRRDSLRSRSGYRGRRLSGGSGPVHDEKRV